MEPSEHVSSSHASCYMGRIKKTTHSRSCIEMHTWAQLYVTSAADPLSASFLSFSSCGFFFPDRPPWLRALTKPTQYLSLLLHGRRFKLILMSVFLLQNLNELGSILSC